MIALKFAKNGNSVCLNLPKEAVAQMRAKVGETIYLSVRPDGTSMLTAYDADFDEQVEAAHRIMQKYKNALRALASR